MRSQIVVIGRDVAMRARLVRLVSRGGYRLEIAESVAHARRRGLKGIALGIVAVDGLDAKEAIELRAALGEVLLVGETDGRAPRDTDLIDISDETRLLARIAEALASTAEREAAEPLLEFAGFRLDLVGHSLRDPKAKEVPLTHGEFALLRALAERRGRVLSRNRLMELTAGPAAEAFDRSVDMQILRLRRKIEADPKRPSLIVTMPGSGYKFIATARVATPVAEPTSERLPEAAPRTAERRHVTALVAELVSPDGGGLPSDPEDLRAAIDEFRGSAAGALAQYGGDHQAPLLILVTTRPEFRAPWSLRSHHSVISLAPLDRVGVARMVRKISASHALSRELIEGVNDRTGGVPIVRRGSHAPPARNAVRLAARRLSPRRSSCRLPLASTGLDLQREAAQIGAVLGRDFSYSLLRAMGGVSDPALQSALDKLAEADLLLVDGAGAQATYRFKHALILDAAYDGLLKSRRQALHRRAAELLSDDPERAAAEPEVVAHHFTQAGLDDLAIEWWGGAGDQALRRSAFQEAIAHLGKAIVMADKLAGATSRQGAGDTTTSSQRLKLQTDYGQAMM
jgi:DNA-binding winged helix-turn-helix (wHTH) protein